VFHISLSPCGRGIKGEGAKDSEIASSKFPTTFVVNRIVLLFIGRYYERKGPGVFRFFEVLPAVPPSINELFLSLSF
jgi:hypothetical protein